MTGELNAGNHRTGGERFPGVSQASVHRVAARSQACQVHEKRPPLHLLLPAALSARPHTDIADLLIERWDALLHPLSPSRAARGAEAL